MEVLRVTVGIQDRAGAGVDLVIVFDIGRAAAVDELDLIFQTPIISAQLALDEHDLTRRTARMLQRDLARPRNADARVGDRLAADGIIRVIVGHFAREEHRAVGRVPLDVHAHHLADRAERQINRAVVQQRIDHPAIHIAEGARHAVDHDRVIRPDTDCDVLRCRCSVRGAPGRNGRAFAADGRGQMNLVPVDVFPHQLTDRADRDICRIIIADRMHFNAIGIIKCLLDPADTDRNVRPEPRGS